MRPKFNFSSPRRRDSGDPWFRVGSVDVTTTVFVSAIAALSMLAYAANTRSLDALVLYTSKVRSGQLWRLVTWPVPNVPSFWLLFTFAMFWYLGHRVEASFGRVRYTWLLVCLTVIPALLSTLLGLLTSRLDVGMGGLQTIGIGVFMAYMAEHPFAPFFPFGIPAWALAVLVDGIYVLSLIGQRAWGEVVFALMVDGIALLVARSYGLAEELKWIPMVPLPGAKRAAMKRRMATGAAEWRGVGVKADTQPQAEMDRLLDKIAASGMDSLTAEEKRRLKAHSKRLRGDN